MADEQSATQLTEEQLKQLQEIHVQINLKGLTKAWKYVTYKKPFSVYQTVARKIEGRSKKMMFGKRSIVGMPVGIVLRNTSRAAYNLSDRKYGSIAQFAGGVAAAASVAAAFFFGGPLIGAGAVGYVAAAAVGAVVLPLPVFTAATLATSTAISAVVGALSTVVAAPANLLRGYRRSKVNLSGAALEKQLEVQEAEFNRRSPSVRYQRELESQVKSGLTQLSAEKKLEVFESLKSEFEPAAAQQTAQAAAPAASHQQRPLPTGPNPHL